MNITIFGSGNFGNLIARLCPADVNINLLSLRELSDKELADVLKQTDILFLAIPFSAYTVSLNRIKPELKAETLLVDVCSVKLKPLEAIEKILPDHKNLLITHPLFGPQSSKNGTQTKGLDLIICHNSGELAAQVLAFCEDVLQLDITEMSAAEHDKQMAITHGLTFFISEILGNFKLSEQILKTPSFEKLLAISGLVKVESTDLLNLIQNDNPFTKDIRSKFIEEAARLNNKYAKTGYNNGSEKT